MKGAALAETPGLPVSMTEPRVGSGLSGFTLLLLPVFQEKLKMATIKKAFS